MNSERIEGPTPAGGDYAIAFWKDAKGEPCIKAKAVAAEIVEYDMDGKTLARTYGTMDPAPTNTFHKSHG